MFCLQSFVVAAAQKPVTLNKLIDKPIDKADSVMEASLDPVERMVHRGMWHKLQNISDNAANPFSTQRLKQPSGVVQVHFYTDH